MITKYKRDPSGAYWGLVNGTWGKVCDCKRCRRKAHKALAKQERDRIARIVAKGSAL